MTNALANEKRSDYTAPVHRHLYYISYQNIALWSFHGLLISSWLMPALSGGTEAGSGNAARQLTYLGLLLAALIGARALKYPFRIVAALPVTVWCVLAFCWMSVAWSLDPGTSVRRLVLTSMMIVGVMLTVRVVGFQATARALIVTMVALLGISLLTVLSLPGIGIHQPNDFDAADLVGNWKGVLGHKNVAGPLASLVIITMVLQPVPIKVVFRIAVICVAAVFLYKTQSKTAMGMLAVALSAGWMFRFYNPKLRWFVVSLCWLTVSGTLLLLWINRDVATAMFSSKDAFTGRVQIWPAMLAYWQDHPMGAGYGAFWNNSTGNPILPYVSVRSYVSIISTGHNGYLDLLVTIGLPGLVLVLLAFVVIPLSRILFAADIPKNRLQFMLAVLLFAIGHNFTESSLMDRDQPMFTIWLIVLSLLPLGRRDTSKTPLLGKL